MPRRVAERFFETFNSQDLDGFEETLHPEVVIEGGRGPRTGREEAREWATFNPGGVQQHQLVGELVEAGDQVLAVNTRQWFWDGTDDLASEEPMFYVLTMRDGLIARWQAFDDRAAAEAALAGGD